MAFGQKPPQGGGDFGNERNSEGNWVDDMFSFEECKVEGTCKNDPPDVYEDEGVCFWGEYCGCQLLGPNGECLWWADCCVRIVYGNVEGQILVQPALEIPPAFKITVSWDGKLRGRQDCRGCCTPNTTFQSTPTGYGPQVGGGQTGYVFKFKLGIVALDNCGLCRPDPDVASSAECPGMSWTREVGGSHTFTIAVSQEFLDILIRSTGKEFNIQQYLNPFEDRSNKPGQPRVPAKIQEALAIAGKAITTDILGDIDLCGSP